MILLDWFYRLFGNWSIIAMAIVALLLIYRRIAPDYYEKMLQWFPWEKKWIILGMMGILVIQAREIIGYPLEWIAIKYPTYTLAEQIFFWIGNIHLRSILFFAIMIFWLWRKNNALMPALISGFFWLGLIELTFIPQHWLWLQIFLGVEHYAPFVVIMIPMLLEWRRFRFPRKMWLWFAGGVFFQWAGLLLAPWAVMLLSGEGFGFAVNPTALPRPHLLTFGFDLIQHLMKTLFTVAGAYITFKKVKEV